MLDPLTLATIAGVIITLGGTVYYAGYKIGRIEARLDAMEERLDTLWDFRVRQAREDAVERGFIRRKRKRDDRTSGRS